MPVERAKYNEKMDAKRKAVENQLAEELTFHPVISEKSQEMAKDLPSLYARSEASRQKKLEAVQAEREFQELGQCTFQPQLFAPLTEQLASPKIGGLPPHERLHCDALARQSKGPGTPASPASAGAAAPHLFH